MTTSSISHRPAAFVAATAATGLAGALLAALPVNAQVIPDPDLPRTVMPAIVDTVGDHPERRCFIAPARWNVALDGPVPRCRAYTR